MRHLALKQAPMRHLTCGGQRTSRVPPPGVHSHIERRAPTPSLPLSLPLSVDLSLCLRLSLSLSLSLSRSLYLYPSISLSLYLSISLSLSHSFLLLFRCRQVNLATGPLEKYPANPMGTTPQARPARARKHAHARTRARAHHPLGEICDISRDPRGQAGERSRRERGGESAPPLRTLTSHTYAYSPRSLQRPECRAHSHNPPLYPTHARALNRAHARTRTQERMAFEATIGEHYLRYMYACGYLGHPPSPPPPPTP